MSQNYGTRLLLADDEARVRDVPQQLSLFPKVWQSYSCPSHEFEFPVKYVAFLQVGYGNCGSITLGY